MSFTKPEKWTRKETPALAQYICLYWKDAWSNKWPMTKDKKFWNSCAKAINSVCGCQRTGLLTYLLIFIHPTFPFLTLQLINALLSLYWSCRCDARIVYYSMLAKLLNNWFLQCIHPNKLGKWIFNFWTRNWP